MSQDNIQTEDKTLKGTSQIPLGNDLLVEILYISPLF